MRSRQTVIKPEDLAGERLYFNDFLNIHTIEVHYNNTVTFMINPDNLGEDAYVVAYHNDTMILNVYDKNKRFMGCGLCDYIVIIDYVIEDEEVPDLDVE